jgi:polysaccharide pyruvyl transferase WcaK-like protein
VRDATSQRIIDGLGVRGGPTPIFPDLAHGLSLPTPVPRPASAPVREVGVNPFPQFDPRYWPVRDLDSYRVYVDRMAGFCAELVRRGYRLHLFPTQVRADPPVVEDLRREILRRVPDGGERIVVPAVATLADLVAVLDGLDMVVATRFHGILFALVRVRPVLGISNHHKMTELMESVGQARYVARIDQLDPADLVRRFEALEAERGEVTREIARRTGELSARLGEQFDVVVGGLRQPGT